MKLYHMVEDGDALARCDVGKEWADGEVFDVREKKWAPYPVADIAWFGRIATKKEVSEFLKDHGLMESDIEDGKRVWDRDAFNGKGSA